jgi:hypothetical protein
MPDVLTVPAGETVTIPSGEVRRASSLDIDGTLDIEGTLQVGQWRLDGRPLPSVKEWSVSPRTVSVTFEIDDSQLNIWREYDRAGDLSVEDGYAGTFRALDRGGRADPVVLQPPPWFAPPIGQVKGYVNSYGESPQGPTRTEISITIQRLTNRQPTTDSVDETGGDWQLRTVEGALALDEDQVAPSPASGTPAGRQTTLTVGVSADQAATLADALAYPGGVTEREIRGEENIVIDESPDEQQTILVGTVADTELRSGEYPVSDWSVEFAGFDDRREFRVELVLAKQTTSVLLVPSGSTYHIPSGTTETYERAIIDGTLDVDGTLNLTGET